MILSINPKENYYYIFNLYIEGNFIQSIYGPKSIDFHLKSNTFEFQILKEINAPFLLLNSMKNCGISSKNNPMKSEVSKKIVCLILNKVH